jgi:hypothetical protein
MYELGRLVGRMLGGGASRAPTESAVSPGGTAAPPSAGRTPEPIDGVVPTGDGRFRAGGYIFASEGQARQFLARGRSRPQGADPATATVQPAAAASERQHLWAPSPRPSALRLATESVSSSQRDLMAEFGITPAPEGGFRARGFVFKTFDQALSWAQRNGKPASGGARLTSAGQSSSFRPAPAASEVRFVPGRSYSGPKPASKSAVAAGKARWIGEPTEMEIGRVSFIAEMVYVGWGDRYAYPRHNSLIDPQQRVASDGDPDGRTLSYWGSYEHLHPTARRTYLEWLARGRSDPTTPIGYVFIFFYGLERRLLYDGSRAEAPALVAEVRRLLEIYGQHASFHGYASRFLDVAEVLASGKADAVEPSLSIGSHWEMPLKVRVHLGALLAEGRPLAADDALLWVLSLPDTYLRTAAKRCFEELRELWALRFAEENPAGLKVRPPKARIKHVYQAASGSFTQNVSIDELPDIASVSAPVARLRRLLEACTDDLDPLSRLLGRRPEARGTIAAAAVAPKELVGGTLGDAFRRCSAVLEEKLEGGRTAAVPFGEVLRLLELDASGAGGRVPAAVMRQVGSLLDGLEYGFEPDRRYGCAIPVSWNSEIVLFPAAGGGKVEPERPAYAAARTMIEIAALAALSDGEAVPVELACIRKDLSSLPGLDEVERLRLMAMAEAMLDDPPKRKEAVARLVALPLSERRRITQSAVSAVLSDGRVLPAEVRFLEGLHTALGLPQEEVYSALHRCPVEEDEPVRVAPEQRSGGVPIARPEAIRIDAARLARIRGETSAVSELLAGIFVEEAEERKAVTQPVESARFKGLDAAHGELLWALVERPLPWDEFETRARGAKLLPSGAIETINEWGFEVLGEPVVEEEDPVGVAVHLVEQVTSFGAVS